MTTPIRALRCLRLVEEVNVIKVRAPRQCANEQLPGSALCAHHLAEAAADYRRITQDALAEACDAD